MEFSLPVKSRVDKFIPKSKFYEKRYVSNKIKQEFTEKISRITWAYKLSDNTINVRKTDKVEEIQIFEVDLKSREVPSSAIQAIVKSIPYPILFILSYENHFCFAISYKIYDTEKLYTSDWDHSLVFNFNGIDLEKVYQNIVKQFITSIDTIDRKFEDIVESDQKLFELEKNINILSNKIKKEKQFNKKVELNKILLENKKELELIKSK